MKSKIWLKFILLSIGGVWISFSSVIIFAAIFNIPVQSFYITKSIVPIPIVSIVKIDYEIPTNIKIPKIQVDAYLENLGLTSKWAVDVPKWGVNAAWYNLGPRPGEVGNAIIMGHYGRWKNGQWSVFDHLHKLIKGDQIYIEDEQWTIISFVVTKIQRYNPSDAATEVFISNSTGSHLNIITCDWDWNKITKHYPGRLVIFADKIIE